MCSLNLVRSLKRDQGQSREWFQMTSSYRSAMKLATCDANREQRLKSARLSGSCHC